MLAVRNDVGCARSYPTLGAFRWLFHEVGHDVRARLSPLPRSHLPRRSSKRNGIRFGAPRATPFRVIAAIFCTDSLGVSRDRRSTRSQATNNDGVHSTEITAGSSHVPSCAFPNRVESASALRYVYQSAICSESVLSWGFRLQLKAVVRPVHRSM